jgi:hypothetical protein
MNITESHKAGKKYKDKKAAFIVKRIPEEE